MRSHIIGKVLCMILLVFDVAFGRLPGDDPDNPLYRGFAYIYVRDEDGAGIPGVNVWFHMDVYFGLPERTKDATSNGVTDQNGYCYLTVDVRAPSYYGSPTGQRLEVGISASEECINVLNSSGTVVYDTWWIYPQFQVLMDCDMDGISDLIEEQIAQKFSPVLHKHSYDEQEGLADIDYLINNGLTTLSGLVDYFPYPDFTTPPPLHRDMPFEDNGFGIGCSYGRGPAYGYWELNIENSVRHEGAPVGSRPIYYHVYQEANYYYLQYWYFFAMNDLTGKTPTWNHTWHEGDWEHVALKLQKNSNFTPVAVNFYQHYGGHTKTPLECWWSSSNNTTYTGIQKGYDENNTHLHIWLAANAHASYNRNDLVYYIRVDFNTPTIPSFHIQDEYVDNVDYDPSGYDLYFEYDYLVKMGEKKSTSARRNSNDGKYYPYAHGKYWLLHYEPVGNSKEWLAFIGRIGDFWEVSFGGLFPTSTPSPTSPAFHDEWSSFTEDYSFFGFGNELGLFEEVASQIFWVDDPPDGDEPPLEQ